MKRINRRYFIRQSALAGGAALLVSSLLPFRLRGNPGPSDADILSIAGDDIPSGIEKLLEAAGGIEKFIRPGNSVGMLVNSPWKHRGFYTTPDIPLAVAKACLEAGASKVICFKPVPDGYWEKRSHSEEYKDVASAITYSTDRVETQITGGYEMKSAEVFRDFLEVDVFINIPVAKHHDGTIFSGNLKNLMGVSSYNTNRHMHSPDGVHTYAKKEYLSRCIADLNLLRKPDLCIVDAIVCGLENGPRGPGETSGPNRILLGTDPVAMDVYASDLAGFYAEDILTSRYAGELGLGKSGLADITVVEV